MNLLAVIRQSIILGLVLTFTGCGYQFRGSGSVLPEDVKTVAIAKVENNTTQSGLADDLQDAIISEFERYGAVRVIEDVNQADAILNTRVVKLETLVRNVTTGTDIALEYDLVMRVNAELTRANGQLLYKNDELSVSESFAGTGDVVVTGSSAFAQSSLNSGTLGTLSTREVSRGAQETALEELVDEVSRRIYLEAVAESF